MIYEVWRDVQALREHFEKPYVKQFVVDSAEYIEGDMEVQWMIMDSGYVPGRPISSQGLDRLAAGLEPNETGDHASPMSSQRS